MNRWTAADVPDQSGRTAVVTGANAGLGFAAGGVLAAKGAKVVLAVRSEDKGRAAAAQMSGDVTVQHLDLCSLESIRAAAEEIRATHRRVDLLINNAGVMYPPLQRTRDGFELQLGTNHLGHFAFTGLLLDRMLPVAGSRVVTVSSLAHKFLARIDFDDLNWHRRYSRLRAYARSKLANLMFTYELQRRLAGNAETIAVAAHPGTSNTDLARHLPTPLRALMAAPGSLVAQSAQLGALPTLRAATDPSVLGGQYYGPGGIGETRGYPILVRSSSLSHDAATQRRLWEVSEELTGVTFPV